jgi:hypothetical protein
MFEPGNVLAVHYIIEKTTQAARSHSRLLEERHIEGVSRKGSRRCTCCREDRIPTPARFRVDIGSAVAYLVSGPLLRDAHLADACPGFHLFAAARFSNPINVKAMTATKSSCN